MEKVKVKDIETFATAVAKRLQGRVPPQYAGATWYGSELMLAGYTDLNPRGLYIMNGYDGITEYNHKEKILEVYRHKRKDGVRNYLNQFFVSKITDKLVSIL